MVMEPVVEFVKRDASVEAEVADIVFVIIPETKV
jgi:hypothetical protein